VLLHHLAHETRELGVTLVTPGNRVGEVRGESHMRLGRAKEAAGQDNPLRLKGAQVQVVSAAMPCRENVPEEPRLRSWKRIDRCVEETRLEQPPDEIPSADATWDPRCPTAGKHDIPSRFVQLLGDLASRLAASNDEHRSRRKRLFVAVVVDVDLEQLRWKRVRSSEPVGALKSPGCEHHRLGAELTAGGMEDKPALRTRLDRTDVHVLSHGSLECRGVAFEIAHHLVPRHEPIRVGPVVVSVGKLDAPVRRHEAEAVPAVAPGLTDPATLENNVLDAGLRQLAADGEPRRACADHGDRDLLVHVRIFTARRAEYDSSNV
jgi:hypothetical protein